MSRSFEVLESMLYIFFSSLDIPTTTCDVFPLGECFAFFWYPYIGFLSTCQYFIFVISGIAFPILSHYSFYDWNCFLIVLTFFNICILYLFLCLLMSSRCAFYWCNSFLSCAISLLLKFPFKYLHSTHRHFLGLFLFWRNRFPFVPSELVFPWILSIFLNPNFIKLECAPERRCI